MPKVLLVDDDKKLVKTLEEVLSKEGLTTRAAYNGVEALKILSEESFDLVVLDLQMPEMDGSRVLMNIRANPKLKEQKVLVCSSAQDWDRGSESLLIKAKSAAWFPEKGGWDGRYTEIYKYNSSDPTQPGAFSTDIVTQIKAMLGK